MWSVGRRSNTPSRPHFGHRTLTMPAAGLVPPGLSLRIIVAISASPLSRQVQSEQKRLVRQLVHPLLDHVQHPDDYRAVPHRYRLPALMLDELLRYLQHPVGRGVTERLDALGPRLDILHHVDTLQQLAYSPLRVVVRHPSPLWRQPPHAGSRL